MRANKNRGWCQVGLRAKSHGVLGRVEWYCSGMVRVHRMDCGEDGATGKNGEKFSWGVCNKGHWTWILDKLSFNIVQICLWIIDSDCSKHMTGNRALLTNFVEKFLGTVRFGNNDFAVIVGYEDVVIGSMTIKKVYYVKGLGHNLFSVGQFCDNGLEVAF
nr:integrase, catalytic region, zinc finger, CCHC-type, peptidase aspartic, catalytic [Tanacetum cinerariifolium]